VDGLGTMGVLLNAEDAEADLGLFDSEGQADVAQADDADDRRAVADFLEQGRCTAGGLTLGMGVEQAQAGGRQGEVRGGQAGAWQVMVGGGWGEPACGLRHALFLPWQRSDRDGHLELEPSDLRRDRMAHTGWAEV